VLASYASTQVGHERRPLFERRPELRSAIHHVQLATLPTPVVAVPRLADHLGLPNLRMKDDGLSADRYGGNKVRKLEFLLGDAIARGARGVMTFGYAGSNHALATAIYARQLGLDPISMLLPQPNATYVRRNLLVQQAVGAELHQRDSVSSLATAAAWQLGRHAVLRGKRPYVIPGGGSSPLGVLGYVNAALELDEQIRTGACPDPELIYIATGSMGTVCGLAIGLALAGRDARIVAVRVTDPRYANQRVLERLHAKTVALLRSHDPSVPALAFDPKRVELREEFFGEGYARFTELGNRAVADMRRAEGVVLDGTYTGKALAAVFADADAGHITNHAVLFWNTYNARDLSDLAETADYRSLPRPFHRYFQQPVQDEER